MRLSTLGFGWRLLVVVLILTGCSTARLMMPTPNVHLDPERDYFEDLAGELKKGKTAFLSLVSKRDFRRRFVKSATDPLAFLLRLQSDIQRPIMLVPQLVFFVRKPMPAVPSLVDIFFGVAAFPLTAFL